MTKVNTSKILIVEDEEDLRLLIKITLSKAGYDVYALENGEIARDFIHKSPPDLLVLDWMLPGVSGLELCQQFSAQIPCLLLTARAESEDIVKGLEAGADDYLVKPFENPILIARVRAILRRADKKNQAPDETLVLGPLRINSKEYRAWNADKELELTRSEFKLLHALMINQGCVMSREKLISLIQGEDISVTMRTIDTHVFGLRKKLGDASALIESIRGVGYRIDQ